MVKVITVRDSWWKNLKKERPKLRIMLSKKSNYLLINLKSILSNDKKKYLMRLYLFDEQEKFSQIVNSTLLWSKMKG